VEFLSGDTPATAYFSKAQPIKAFHKRLFRKGPAQSNGGEGGPAYIFAEHRGTVTTQRGFQHVFFLEIVGHTTEITVEAFFVEIGQVSESGDKQVLRAVAHIIQTVIATPALRADVVNVIVRSVGTRTFIVETLVFLERKSQQHIEIVPVFDREIIAQQVFVYQRNIPRNGSFRGRKMVGRVQRLRFENVLILLVEIHACR